MSDKRAVSVEEGEKKAKEYGVMFIETSAKAGFNVKALFRKLALALPGSEQQRTQQPSAIDVKLKSVNLQEQANQQQASGCAC